MQDYRYSRQVLFSKIGEEGQEKLIKSKVIIIGCGALGSIIANNLIRAGIGRIRIVDRDFVELNNLQRQCLFDEQDAKNRLPKAIAIKRKLEGINTEVGIEALVEDVNHRNVEELIGDADVVLDGTDNMETRFLLNDACIKNNIRWIYGAVVGSIGATMNIIPGEGPCLRCVIGQIPEPGSLETCDTIGIINTIPNTIGSLEVTEAIKILVEDNDISKEELLYFDIWERSFQKLRVKQAPDCPTCVKREFTTLKAKDTMWVTSLCGRNAVQIMPQTETQLSMEVLEKKFRSIGRADYNGFLLTVSIDKHEIVIFPNARVIIKGTNDIAEARSIYARYIGS